VRTLIVISNSDRDHGHLHDAFTSSRVICVLDIGRLDRHRRERCRAADYADGDCHHRRLGADRGVRARLLDRRPSRRVRRRAQRRSEAPPCAGATGRDRLRGVQAVFDNVTRSGHALLGIINAILDRDLTAAIDVLKILIGDVHVPA
jgi:hypothetical protein